jgi:UDP-GlcNAc:undecaprenyl-phosphate GlcNAc-1-phosphate transferase
MNPMLDSLIVGSALAAFAVSATLTPIIRDAFLKRGLVDAPGGRKLHAKPVPRIGGIPLAIAYGVAMVMLSSRQLDLAWRFLPGAALILATGLLDDLFTLKPLEKLAGQTLAAGAAFACGLRLDSLAGYEIPLGLQLPLTLAWLLVTANALNLIDGLDGLCAGVGLLSAGGLFGAALLLGDEALAMTTLPLAAALAGFLIFNFNPASVFLGDSGALLIGFLLGCFGLAWCQKTATLLSVTVPLLAVGVPLTDLSLSVLRRLAARRPIFAADRGHIHHRLMDLGLTHRSAVLVLYAAGAIAASAAVWGCVPGINP